MRWRADDPDSVALKMTPVDVESKCMGRSVRHKSAVLIGVLAMGTAACGGLVGDEATEEDTLISAPPVEPVASLASADQAPGPDESDFDLELTVSKGEPADESVTVTVQVRSVGEDRARSPFIRVDLGRDMALSESNVACFENQSEILCAPIEAESDEEGTTDTHVLDVAIEGVFHGEDSTVTFTAESADTQVSGDNDMTNNSVTVMFIETETQSADEPEEGLFEFDLEPVPLEPIPVEPPAEEEVPADLTDLYTLEVHTDGCGVFRTGEVGDDLTWVITDADGFQVLGRNAAGETQYRYWLAGTYSVVLESWGGSYYVEVSNTVTINC